MKNKNVVIVCIVLLLLFVGGALFINSKSTKTTTTMTKDSGSVFSSVKDALSKKLTLVCEFSDEDGVKSKSYIKNGAVRVSTIAEGSQNEEFVLKDNKMYMWNEATKEGFVYDVPEEETNTEVNQGDSYLKMIDTYKDSCKVGAVEDLYFVIPSDVKFQDMSKLLEDLKKQMPQIPNQ